MQDAVRLDQRSTSYLHELSTSRLAELGSALSPELRQRLTQHLQVGGGLAVAAAPAVPPRVVAELSDTPAQPPTTVIAPRLAQRAGRPDNGAAAAAS